MADSPNDIDRNVPGRRNQVAKLAHVWRSSLIDVSGANRLLFYKPLRVGTLDVTEADPGALRALEAGEIVQSNKLFKAGMFGPEVGRSLKSIHTKAKVVAEEFGIDVSFLASGFATWAQPAEDGMPTVAKVGVDGTNETRNLGQLGRNGKTSRVPLAPLFLRPLTITGRLHSSGVFSLQASTEIQINPVMLHLFRETFQVKLDEAAFFESHVSANTESLYAALAEKLTASVPGFAVVGQSAIANFLYSGQPMVEDMGEANLDLLASNDIIAALAGDVDATAAARSAGDSVNVNAPDFTPPSVEYLVLDADASQSYVINAALAGQNIVIQGPPGTGKSQTIANLIAELVAQKKTILFVAQKRAAITAVLGRLRDVGLEQLGLDLFEVAKSRKAVVAAIGQSLEDRKLIGRPEVGHLHLELEQNRKKLVDHNDAMYELRSPWSMSILGRVDKASEGAIRGFLDWSVVTEEYGRTELRLPIKSLEKWEPLTHDRLRLVVRELFEKQGVYVDSSKPGWSPDYLTSTERVSRGTEIATRVVDDELPIASSVIQSLCGLLGISQTGALTWERATKLLELAERASAVQRVAPVLLDSGSLNDGEIASFAAAVGSSAYRGAAQVKLGYFERRTLKKKVRSYVAPSIATENIHALLLDATGIRAMLRDLGASTPTNASNLPQLRPALRNLGNSLAELQQYIQAINLSSLDWISLKAEINSLRSDRGRFALPDLFEKRTMLNTFASPRFAQDIHDNMPISAEAAVDRFSYAFVRSVLDHLEGTDRRISGVSGADLERWSNAFALADVKHRSTNAGRVLRVAADNLRDALQNHREQTELIASQVKRKRGYKSVRDLFSDASEVMLAAKPLWAMSPQKASELLPARQMFDVVIFDEASQVMPAAAIPAIARGSRVVVAGDSLQLPPTTLFTRTLEALYADDDTEIRDEFLDDGKDGSDRPGTYTAGVDSRDMESILEAVELKLGSERSRHLSWHYRSEDERLIATSNEYVYKKHGRTMTTFPSAHIEGALTHETVEPSRGLGANNKSPVGEVERVADLVQEHVHASPARTLGVIAFGSEHSNRIEAELDRRELTDPALSEYRGREGKESFFVKNIERVQGDERDRIILTVGYAQNDNGRLSYNWGPVLNEGGHRRVNVAISRAKSQMTLVTSFKDEDVDPNKSTADGFQLMRHFITFASTKGEHFGDEGSKNVPMNPFEYDILMRLRNEGLDVVPQWGAGGYRIDFAVRHPKKPGKFLLAIEADGASYHSGTTARERDRLRQQLLERRGWRFVRIWSTDWFYDPAPQVARVLASYKLALEEDEAVPTLVGSIAPAQSQPSLVVAVAAPARGKRPNIEAGYKINDYSDEQLQRMVRHVRSDDVAHTRDEIREMVKGELGFKRDGKNIVDRISAAIQFIEKNG